MVADSTVQNSVVASGPNAMALGERAVSARDTYGPIITGNDATIIFRQKDEVDWDNVDYSKALEMVAYRFEEHMRRFAGAADGQDAVDRYEPLFLQKAAYVTTTDEIEPDKHGQERPLFVWDEGVHLPTLLVLVGEAGSGKTTQLLYAAQDLARQSAPETPIPIYLPLRSYAGKNAAELLESLANASGLEIAVIAGLLREADRPICLFLDGADELPQADVQGLLRDIFVLWQQGQQKQHSIIFSSRYGSSAEAILNSQLDFEQVDLLPLNPDQIESLLKRYGLAELTHYARQELSEVLQSPDFLSALSQGLQGQRQSSLPRTVGEIYQLYVESRLLVSEKTDYSYAHVIRPVLSLLAITMLEQQVSRLIIRDALATELIDLVTKQIEHQRRLRSLAPADWTLSHLLAELSQSPFVRIHRNDVGDEEVYFTKQGYRDYFAAVFMCDVQNHERIIEALTQNDRPDWLQPIFMMAGLQTGPNQLLETYYTLSTEYAVDIWMQSRPMGPQGPEIIQKKTKTRYEEALSTVHRQIDEPITNGFLAKFLVSPKPAHRLAAAAALTQWGLSGADLLLAAVQDDQPLVSAVAGYALLHLGEMYRDETGVLRPLQPLISVENGLHFTNRGSGGGVLGSIGPVDLIFGALGQSSGRSELSLSIMNYDFDPFAVAANFSLSHIEPIWYAENWFKQLGKVDWVALLGNLNSIVTIADKVWQKAAALDSPMQSAFKSRRDQFLVLVRLIENDLDCPPLIELSADLDRRTREHIERHYRQFHNMYQRKLRRKFLGSNPDNWISYDKRDSNRQDAANFAISLEDINIRSNYPVGPGDRRSLVSATESINELRNGRFTAIHVENLREGTELLPTYIELKANVNVGSIYDSRLQGVSIENLRSHQGGGLFIQAELQIRDFQMSRVAGVHIENLTSADEAAIVHTQMDDLAKVLHNTTFEVGETAEALYKTLELLVRYATAESKNRELVQIYADGLEELIKGLPEEAAEAANLARAIAQRVDGIGD